MALSQAALLALSLQSVLGIESITTDVAGSQAPWAEHFQDPGCPHCAAKHGRHLLGSSRVGRVGVGVFLILFFMGVCLAICLAGSRTKVPWVFYLTSAAIFAIVFGVLAGSPKGPAPVKPPTGYDMTIVPLCVIMSLLVLGSVLAPVGLIIFQASPRVYAKPLSHTADVLGIR